jgi:hypothetical protein
MWGRSAALHFPICLGLIFLFGGAVHSLSVDFALHFALIDSLAKYGIADPQLVALMSDYPRLGHWMAAGLGYVVGSDLVAMWLMCIVAIYACYFALARLATWDGRIFGLCMFVAVTAAAAITHAVVGFEIVDNFFYPQLVGTAVYFLILPALVAIADRSAWIRICLVLPIFAFVLEIHTLPALHLAGAFWLLLIFELALEFIGSKRLSVASAMPTISFPVFVLLVLWLDPTVRTAFAIAQHNGSLPFGLSPGFLFALAVVAGCIWARVLWLKLGERQTISAADLVVSAALLAAVGLMAAQYLAFTLLGSGSFYVIKKHLFIVLTLGILALSRSVEYMLPNKRLQLSLPVLSACGAAAICAIVLRGPGYSIYPIVRDLAYAERASSFPEFKPGNTFVGADSINFVIKFLISITAFKAKLDAPSSAGLIDGTFIAQRDTSFLMVDRTPAVVERCNNRQAETSKFAIIPTSCLSQIAPDDLVLWFGKDGNGGPYLSSGWLGQEAWGVWQGESPGVVTVHLPSGLRNVDVKMSFTANAFVVKENLSLAVSVNDKPLATLSLPQAQPYVIAVPRELTEGGILKITFTARNAVSPASVGQSADTRVLGLGLRSLRLEKASK